MFYSPLGTPGSVLSPSSSLCPLTSGRYSSFAISTIFAISFSLWLCEFDSIRVLFCFELIFF